jgi:hypothetical protein
MTLLEIEILSHYYCRADDWRNGDHSAPILKETFGRFLDQGLLTHDGFTPEFLDGGALRARYAVTDKTRAYIEALQRVPLPEQVWVVPAQPASTFGD